MIFRCRFDRFRCLDRGGRKTIENSLAFAISLHKEIGTSRLLWPEQFSAGAALILLLFAKMIFRRRFDRYPCLDRSRCSKTIENSLAVAICLHQEIDASRLSRPEQFSAGEKRSLSEFFHPVKNTDGEESCFCVSESAVHVSDGMSLQASWIVTCIARWLFQ